MQLLWFSTLMIMLLCDNVAKHGVLGYSPAQLVDILESVNTSTVNTSEHGRRSGKYLFPFAVINFPPEPCSPINTQQMDGVCLSKTRCVSSGGETVGACQQGLGTCCKFTKQCNSNRRSVTVVETVENIMSSSMAGSCEFVFPKQSGICQIRLDFVNVNLQEAQARGPNTGNCQSESITVSGASNINGPLKVCGRLSGQHMILSFGSTSDLISIIVHSELSSANYHIRATQIPCNSPYKPPDDCLQYYQSTTAAVKSFGFPRQLNNQRYTICVQPNSGGSTLSWDKCMDNDADGTMAEDRFKVSERSIPCLTDWIAIDAEKRCGQTFLPMTTVMGSHSRIRVNFDESEAGNDIFTVTIPAGGGTNIKEQCEGTDPQGSDGVIITSPTFTTPGRRLCNYTTIGNMNLCQCRFSSEPDNAAQGFELTIPSIQENYVCPKVEGYTAYPEKTDQTFTTCKYYAKIRITDTDNTGFCLRYQAM